MLRIAAIATLLTAASASAQRAPVSPPPPLALHTEFDELLRDLATIEAKMGKLQGDFRTMKAINRRIEAMRRRVQRLKTQAPASIQPHVVVNLGSPTPPVVVLQPTQPPPTTPPPEPPGPDAMANADFDRLMNAVNAESFSDGKLGVVRTAAGAHHFTIGQVKRLVNAMSFSKDKVAVVRITASKILDPENAFQLYEAFTYSTDKRKVREILGQ